MQLVQQGRRKEGWVGGREGEGASHIVRMHSASLFLASPLSDFV